MRTIVILCALTLNLYISMRQKNRKELVGNGYLFPFMQEMIEQLKSLGKARTSETYQSALASFMRFRDGKDVLISSIKDEMIVAYEISMKASGLSSNTTSFYMRILRAVYNRAVKLGITRQKYPFKYVYTGIAKTRRGRWRFRRSAVWWKWISKRSRRLRLRGICSCSHSTPGVCHSLIWPTSARATFRRAC